MKCEKINPRLKFFKVYSFSGYIPKGQVGFVPFVASEGIAFPANISLDLTSKLIRNPTTRPLHGSERGRMEKFNQVISMSNTLLGSKGIFKGSPLSTAIIF